MPDFIKFMKSGIHHEILYFGGERGIRTPGTVARTPHFECGPIDHSGISPFPDRHLPITAMRIHSGIAKVIQFNFPAKIFYKISV